MMEKGADRDLAVLILLVCASRGNETSLQLSTAADYLSANYETYDLAREAWIVVPCGNSYEEDCAEAAALLDSGWCIDDPAEPI